MHFRPGYLLGSICQRCLRASTLLSDSNIALRPSRTLYRQLAHSRYLEQNENSSSQSIANESGASKSDSHSSSDTEEKKSRWSNWTGKNAWKASLVFLAATFGGSAVAMVYSWGQ